MAHCPSPGGYVTVLIYTGPEMAVPRTLSCIALLILLMLLMLTLMTSPAVAARKKQMVMMSRINGRSRGEMGRCLMRPPPPSAGHPRQEHEVAGARASRTQASRAGTPFLYQLSCRGGQNRIKQSQN